MVSEQTQRWATLNPQKEEIDGPGKAHLRFSTTLDFGVRYESFQNSST